MIAIRFSLPRQILALSVTLSISLLIFPAYGAGSKPTEIAGANLFRDKGCAYCHGANGQGTPKGPSLLNIRKTWKAPKITEQIENGGQKMPSFQDSLTTDEVTDLVAYLRAKHRPMPTPATPAPPQPSVSNPEQ